MPPQSRTTQGFAGDAVEIDLILKGIKTCRSAPRLRPKERSCPFPHASITSISGQIVPSVLAASLPNTPERAWQQVEASRTVGRCDRKAFGATGRHGGKRWIVKGREEMTRVKAILGE